MHSRRSLRRDVTPRNQNRCDSRPNWRPATAGCLLTGEVSRARALGFAPRSGRRHPVPGRRRRAIGGGRLAAGGTRGLTSEDLVPLGWGAGVWGKVAWKRRGREWGREKKKGAGDAGVGRTDSAARIVLDGMANLLGSSSFSRSRSSREPGRGGEDASRAGATCRRSGSGGALSRRRARCRGLSGIHWRAR